AYFVQLDRLPLTSNDKVDRKALPEPDRNNQSGIKYEAPRNFIEENIVSIWEEVLGIKPIGISNNFFEMGGNSLKLMSVVSSINKIFNTDISIHDFFENPNIKKLAHFILSTESNQNSNCDDYIEEEV
ncbi:hypothetical protein H1Z61_16390, partial [Bacillus aquiflavi]